VKGMPVFSWQYSMWARGSNLVGRSKKAVVTTSDHFLCPHGISLAQGRHVRMEKS
jgi:hypothetical protein